MSKSKVHTRDKIRDQALKMFNERGIEYVGLRELAGVLNMRVSNITYYFPTKDDLVYELSLELSRANARIIVPRDNMTLATFMQLMYEVFQNQLQFRCLLLSIVHVMEQNKAIAAAYKTTQTDRYAAIRSNLHVLAASGYLHIQDETVMDALVSTIALISRFWISEARISFRALSDEEQMRHYLGLIIQVLLPHATTPGKKDINAFYRQMNEKQQANYADAAADSIHQ